MDNEGLGFCEILTLILVAAKLFCGADLTWLQCFAPIWLPLIFIGWLGLMAWNWVVWLILNLFLIGAMIR